MSAAVREAVDEWKARTLQNNDIALESACSAIGKDNQPFEAQKVNAVEWVVSTVMRSPGENRRCSN